MAIRYFDPLTYASPGAFVQQVMTTDQELYGSGTMMINGQAPSVDRSSSTFFVISDEVFKSGYAVPGASPPFIVWRVRDMVFDRVKQTGGFNASDQDTGSGVPDAIGLLTGTIGSWFTTFEAKTTGRNAAEALNEVNNLMGTLEQFPSNPPIRKQRCTPLAQGDVKSNGTYTFVLSFEVPLIVNPAPLSMPVLILTASATIETEAFISSSISSSIVFDKTVTAFAS